MRLIDADAFKKQIQENVSTFYTCGRGGYYLAEDVIEDIDNVPTVDIKTEVAREIIEKLDNRIRKAWGARFMRLPPEKGYEWNEEFIAVKTIYKFIDELKSEYEEEGVGNEKIL